MRGVGRVLVLGAHDDDPIIGMGGTISRLVREKVPVSVVIFTQRGFNEYGWTCLMEAKTAYGMFGIEPVFLGHDDRRLFEKRQDVLEYLYGLRDRFDTVFTHQSRCTHQDHVVVYEEAVRAFRTGQTILGYRVIGSEYEFDGRLSVEITEEDVKRKEEALKMFRTQYSRLGGDFGIDVIGREVAEVHGYEAGVKYAEKFEIIRMVKKVGR